MDNQEKTALINEIMQTAPDAILYADADGLIRLWNQGAERLFGFTEVEALGQSLDLIIPENLRQRHWDGYYKVMKTGQSHYQTDLLSAPATTREGKRLSTEFSMVLLKDEQGQPKGVAAIMRDVSERWQREKELKQKIATLQEAASLKG
ncbi:MAG: PAS domain-containing protein [Desulfuromonadales bacterium]